MPHSHSVLIVEDDAAIRDVFAELLRAEGHAVSLAEHGEEAMGMLLHGMHPCLIVADLLMPVLDGWGLAARLTAEPKLASIPFVVVSALPVSGSREMPPGARARLTKPVALAHLLATVDQHCALAPSSREGRVDALPASLPGHARDALRAKHG